MKTNDMLLFGAVAAIGYYLWKRGQKPAAQPAMTPGPVSVPFFPGTATPPLVTTGQPAYTWPGIDLP